MSFISVFYKRESFLYLFAIVVSLALSLWIDLHEIMINPDAICCLLSAKAVESGIGAAMRLCTQAHWPFYSVLIYGLGEITHLDYATAAYILNSLFSALSVVCFILIVNELGGSRRVCWLAALSILLWHDFNGVREYIIRDHGFWGFYLLSILMLIRYFSEPRWITGLAFGGSIFIATLFRIEGIFFLLTMPFLSWFCFRYSLQRRAIFFLNLNIVTLFLGAALFVWFLLHPQETLAKLGRVSEIIPQIQAALRLILERYAITKVALGKYMLTSDSSHQAGLILFLVMVIWYVLIVIRCLSWVYTLLIAYAWWSRRMMFFTSTKALVLTAYILVNLAFTMIFFWEHLFLSKRYVIALSLIFMLWVPFALDDLIKKWPDLRYRLFLLVTSVFVFISALGGIFDFGYSKLYMLEAGNWLAKNVSQTSSLYCNNYQVMYYSKHFGNTIFEQDIIERHINTIAEGRWKQYDYIALRLGNKLEKDMAAVLQEMSLKPIQVFSNKRGDRIEIFKTHL